MNDLAQRITAMGYQFVSKERNALCFRDAQGIMYGIESREDDDENRYIAAYNGKLLAHSRVRKTADDGLLRFMLDGLAFAFRVAEEEKKKPTKPKYYHGRPVKVYRKLRRVNKEMI